VQPNEYGLVDMKAVVAAGGAVGAIFSLVLGLAAITGGTVPPAAAAVATESCVTSGPLRGLSDVAANNARIVTASAERMAGAEGAVIAVMVGYTESGLRVLGNPAVNAGGVPVQGNGSDHDSVGIFQQRSSWGSAAQRLDPVLSTGLFVARLIVDPGWRSKQPWVAAQDVQASAYDGRPRAVNHGSAVYGGNYAANADLAQRLVAQIDRDAAKLACGSLTGGVPANTAPGSHGLPADYVVPAPATVAEGKVVLFAIAQLDKPYVFGAAGPAAFDCSGLTMAAWAQAGIQLVHATTAQARSGTPTTATALVPGDLVLVPGDDGTIAAPGHVGLYIGDGLVLNAADEQAGIRVQTYANFVQVGHGLSALRHIA
jgi:peptidoglycan DL-endopeptidase CwlO